MQFSVTTGTVLADRKAPIRTYLVALALMREGLSSLAIARQAKLNPRAMHLLRHKLEVFTRTVEP